jgi:hypothetical protein
MWRSPAVGETMGLSSAELRVLTAEPGIDQAQGHRHHLLTFETSAEPKSQRTVARNRGRVCRSRRLDQGLQVPSLQVRASPHPLGQQGSFSWPQSHASTPENRPHAKPLLHFLLGGQQSWETSPQTKQLPFWQTPPSGTPPPATVEQALKSVSLPASLQSGWLVRVAQTVAPRWHAGISLREHGKSGLHSVLHSPPLQMRPLPHDMSSEASPHRPSEQDRQVPHDVPFGFLVSLHTGEPDEQSIFPVLQGSLPHAAPALHDTHAPPLHTLPDPHDFPVPQSLSPQSTFPSQSSSLPFAQSSC